MKPIYEPKGAAKEYGDYAINIYTGCPHNCFYCFAPNVLRKERNSFHSVVEPRKDIVKATATQIKNEGITGKLIHLCFVCDPYPTGYDTTPTRDIIKLLKDSGNNVQILTKGDGSKDFDLLDENDWYGITIDGLDMPAERVEALKNAHELGIKTWVSFEPVVDDKKVIEYITELGSMVDKIKIGKLNYFESKIDWKEFGKKVEALCKEIGVEYYIKESLRAFMKD